jgi:hypothetical protein
MLESEILLLDVENIAMMLGTCIICYICPLELLLASYAFLGPAHYLTQISWLHDRAYFCGSRLLILLLTPLAVLMAVYPDPDSWKPLLCLSLAIAAALVTTRSPVGRVAIVAVIAALYFAFLRKLDTFGLIVVFLLPTVVHIFVFTTMFMIAGFAKTRAPSSLVSIAVLIACAGSFFVIPSSLHVYATGWVDANIGIFMSITEALLYLDGYTSETAPGIVHPIMQFIAFAYTYHYLNWFSKTRLIGWNKVSRQRLAFIVVSYVVFVSLYAYDYKLGFQALLFLSMLHVILEFPLDVVTAKTLGGLFTHHRIPARA